MSKQAATRSEPARVPAARDGKSAKGLSAGRRQSVAPAMAEDYGGEGEYGERQEALLSHRIDGGLQGALQDFAGIPASGGDGPQIRLPGVETSHPMLAQMNEAGTRFRLPKFEKVKAAYSDKTLKIPEAVVKDRVARLLGRMAKEGRLKSKDSVATIIGKIFPAPGVIDEAEFNKAIDVSDRKSIYENVNDANTKVKGPDKPKLKAAIGDSIDLIKKAEADAAGLKEVFGSKDATAKANYGKARVALDNVSKSMDTSISTDYNLDDPEVGLGGWANFSSQHMHLLVEVVKVTDAKETKVTLIHEASHLSNPAVDDQGYYGSPAFEAKSEADKVGNAAHYEELPRRQLGTSLFAGVTFKPGVLKGGGAVTREDRVREDANTHMRKAWDAAVDAHSLIRGLRIQYLKGNSAPFATHRLLVMEMSKLMDLSIHEQAAANAIVTTLDVTLSESVARAMSMIGDELGGVPFPSPIGAQTDTQLREKLVAGAVVKYGSLLGDAKRDKDLIDWMVAHYRSLPGV